MLKNFYDEEIFTLLVKEIYSSDINISEAAIRSSGSLGNEVAIPHLYQIIEGAGLHSESPPSRLSCPSARPRPPACS